MLDMKSWLYALGGGAAAVMATYYLVRSLFPWLRYDIQYLRAMVPMAITIKGYQRKHMCLIDIFEQQVKKRGQKTMLIFEGKKYTYVFINKQANKVAHVAQSLGLKKGDTVAMLQLNEAEFIWTYFGFLKIGVIPAFLNTNLRSKSLLHCFSVSSATMLFVGKGGELLQAVEEIYNDIVNNNSAGMAVYVQGEQHGNFHSFDALFREASDADIDPSGRAGITFKDTINYIYTSGTTGLPKAAVVTQAKAVKGSVLFQTLGISEDDVFYTALPLYHSAAGIMALGTTIVIGGTLVLRKKFSASAFFAECAEHDVTVIQYIGELCRYLLATKPAPTDATHKVRLAVGNGLRPDIWQQFVERFKISQVGEFYAATEGNAGFINVFNKRGCIGRNSPFLRWLIPLDLIRFDVAEEEPVRNKQGFCMPVLGAGEPGLMVSQIRRDFEYDGYKGNDELSRKKILKDVFRKGDMYFHTGDLLVMDEEYFVYFNDRIGDTFRWKGENVSTVEVSNVITDLSWIEDTCVYGVQIPGQDGRCGMAAITPVGEHVVTAADREALYRHCDDMLPSYARPRFIRILPCMQTTGTFKQQKFRLQQEGFWPEKCAPDPLYYLDLVAKQYKPLDDTAAANIKDGAIRF